MSLGCERLIALLRHGHNAQNRAALAETIFSTGKLVQWEREHNLSGGRNPRVVARSSATEPLHISYRKKIGYRLWGLSDHNDVIRESVVDDNIRSLVDPHLSSDDPKPGVFRLADKRTVYVESGFVRDAGAIHPKTKVNYTATCQAGRLCASS